jgi:hypothetical protein
VCSLHQFDVPCLKEGGRGLVVFGLQRTRMEIFSSGFLLLLKCPRISKKVSGNVSTTPEEVSKYLRTVSCGGSACW